MVAWEADVEELQAGGRGGLGRRQPREGAAIGAGQGGQRVAVGEVTAAVGGVGGSR